MDIQTLTRFFKWCTILNGGLLAFSALLFTAFPDFAYGAQVKFYPISREAFDLMFYGFLGLLKLFFLSCNLVPYVALVIAGKKAD
ncbi:MAG: hypothetical protein VCD50_05730 [Alphaproteobacteria bacterium]|jgi:hypothetical protein